MKLDFRQFLEAGDLTVLGTGRDHEVSRWKRDILRALRKAAEDARAGDHPEAFMAEVTSLVGRAPPRPEATSIANALRACVHSWDSLPRSMEGRQRLLGRMASIIKADG